MSDTAVATTNGRHQVHAIEQALVQGNLSALSPEQRVTYYNRVCESLGLNPFTRPFEYITLNGKLTLYARKDCTDQLRNKHRVSIDPPIIKVEEDMVIVSVSARLPDGRTDSDIGAVSRKDMRGDQGNVLMKAMTKAKRRVTLSICGLGMLDETEVETITDAVPHQPEPLPPANRERAVAMSAVQSAKDAAKGRGLTADAWTAMLAGHSIPDLTVSQLWNLEAELRNYGSAKAERQPGEDDEPPFDAGEQPY